MNSLSAQIQTKYNFLHSIQDAHKSKPIEKTKKETEYLAFKCGKSETWNKWVPDLPLLPWWFFFLWGNLFLYI